MILIKVYFYSNPTIFSLIFHNLEAYSLFRALALGFLGLQSLKIINYNLNDFYEIITKQKKNYLK